MPTITPEGTVQKRTGSEIIQSGKDAARNLWGGSVNTRGTGSIQKLLEAFVAMGIGEFENAADELYKQRYMRWATGQALDDSAWPLFYRLQPTKAVGTMNLVLTSALAAPDPLFVAGTVTFSDSSGLKYELIEDVVPNGTTDVTASVRAVEFGAEGNVAADEISDPQGLSFSNPTVEADWGTYVESFNNDAEFTGGRDLETDRQFRRRIQDSPTAREGASVDGLELAIGRVDGVTGVRVLENTSLVGGSEDTGYEFLGTGTASQTIDGTRTEASVRIVVAEAGFFQHFALKLNANSSLIVDVRLETDNAGEPSGVLVGPEAVLEDFAFGGTVPTTGTLNEGYDLEPGTYHLRLIRVSGSGSLDGSGSGTANGVKGRNTSGDPWANDTNIENAYAQLIGGLPGASFRAIVSGSPDPDAVAQVIWKNKAAGIRPDGNVSGTAIRRGGTPVTVAYSQPDEVPVVLNIEVQVTSEFGGDEDSIRDLAVAYVGGNDTQGGFVDGLAVNDTLVRNEIVQRLLDDDEVLGIFDVTKLWLDRKSNVAGGDPANLTSADVDNLPSSLFEELLIDDPAVDILVSIVQV